MENNQINITCRDLWNKWKKTDPNSVLVKQSEESMKKYSKNDWKIMSAEALDIMNKLSDLSRNKISIENLEAKNVFFELLNHVKKWFFIPTKEYATILQLAIAFEDNYKDFFNKYENNLSIYMIDLINKYKNEI